MNNTNLIKVLVFPGSSEIGLEIISCLSSCKEIKLYSASQDARSSAHLETAKSYILPTIYEATFLDELNELCRSLNIDFIYPAYDDISVFLAENSDIVISKIISPDYNISKILRSKLLTYKALDGVIKVPRVIDTKNPITFPMFIKPNIGQGSKDAYRVNNHKEFEFYSSKIDNFVLTEFLPGKEFTVDCLCTKDNQLIYSAARERIITKNGICTYGKSFFLEEAEDIARRIKSIFKLQGAWFFQLKEDYNGSLTLLEIGPRIAGTMALNRLQGINLPLLSIYVHAGMSVDILPNDLSITISRHLRTILYSKELSYEEAYIDYDDTILINDLVNIQAILFIYRCINKGIRVYLITRHEGDIFKSLSKHRLDSLFDDIYHLKESEPKSKYFKTKKAVFVDDSFRERVEVRSALGVPTFDPSALEYL